ncbi:hypothetical protein BX600DRAFT_509547 [Xylariales sp. PMI_506]|nr:hypothetical protein BX600DRAFT_509547 [Xylariales sp. PMI_506]
MGSFVFKWEHPASEVYVTGTFDNWTKSEKLDKVGEHFEKDVTLKDASQKIYYKFVVDGNWVTDHTAPKEADEEGNENNVLTPERIVTEAPATAALVNSAAPESTTAALAANVPVEKKDTSLPGTFPETPAADVNKEFSVNPLPAVPGSVNPIKLAPGEKIPENLTSGSTTDNIKLDPESYEKSDALPGVVTAFSSAAPESTTATLAAQVPLEPTVPEVVKESQEKANVDPEASAIPEEVKEKAAVEEELLEKVKEAPSTSEGTAGQGTEKTEDVVTPGEAVAAVTAAATALGGAAIAGAVAAKDTAVEKATAAVSTAQTSATEAASNLPDSIKDKLPESVQNVLNTTSKEATIEEISPEVPVEVKESIVDAGFSPEAAANTVAVEEKKAVEEELLKEVKPTEPISASAAAEPAAVAETVQIEEVAPSVPTEVKESIAESGKSPEAAANPVAVEEKKAVEAELLTEVKPTEAAENTEATPANESAAAESSAPANGSATVESSAPANGSAAAESAAPANGANTANGATAVATSSKPAEAPTTAEKKKKNRLSSFFNKLKGSSKKSKD